MKRIFLLTIALFILCANSFAQIRVEKRHYNRGWYITTPKHKKNIEHKTGEQKAIPVAAAFIEVKMDTVSDIEPVSAPQIVQDTVVITKEVDAKKPALPKRVVQTVIKEVKEIPALDVKKPTAFTERKTESSKQITSNATPDELIDGIAEFIIDVIQFFITLLLVAIVLAIVFGAILIVCLI